VNDDDVKGVVRVLKNKGITDVEMHEYWNPQYWRLRVRRRPPAAAIHAANIRAVHQLLKTEPECQEHLNSKLHVWFENYATLCERGHYEPPDDVPLFTCIGQDKDGLNLYAYVQYADFEEAQEEAIPCHSRRGLTRESIMTHS
jgi:hypothetical protein